MLLVGCHSSAALFPTVRAVPALLPGGPGSAGLSEQGSAGFLFCSQLAQSTATHLLPDLSYRDPIISTLASYKGQMSSNW